jgi:hypothetical protein
MLGLASALLDPPRRHPLLDAPIRGIGQRALEYLELIPLGLVLSLIVVMVWGATSSRAREQARRAGQVEWRRQLQERKHRLALEPKRQNDERLGPTG